MADPDIYLDVKDVEFSGVPLAQVGRVLLAVRGDEITHSAEADNSITYRGMTGKYAEVSIDFREQVTRDVDAITLGLATLTEISRANLSESGTPVMHSSELDGWIRYIAVKDRACSGSVRGRGIEDVIAQYDVGTLAALEWIIALIREDQCGIDEAYYEKLQVARVQITGWELEATHGGFAEVGFDWASQGTLLIDDASYSMELAEGGGESGLAVVNIGDTGTLTYKIPKIDGVTDMDVTILNCVALTADLTCEHGALTDRSLTFNAFSSTGNTTPISID